MYLLEVFEFYHLVKIYQKQKKIHKYKMGLSMEQNALLVLQRHFFRVVHLHQRCTSKSLCKHLDAFRIFHPKLQFQRERLCKRADLPNHPKNNNY